MTVVTLQPYIFSKTYFNYYKIFTSVDTRIFVGDTNPSRQEHPMGQSIKNKYI